MDCNNYSYVNHSGKTNVVAEAENSYGIPTITITAECNYFGECFYYVADLMGDFAETFPMNATGYQEAVKAFNTLVPESDRIYPMF